MCDRCAYLEAENASLQRKIIQLQQIIRRMGEVIKRQKQQIDDVRRYVWDVMCKAGEIFAKTGGVKRADWIMWKGRNEVASKVYGLLMIDWAKAILDAIQSI